MQNLSSGFHEFIQDAESRYVDGINYKLSEFYQKEGSWLLLKTSDQNWKLLIDEQKNKNENNNLLPTDPSGISQLLQTQKRVSLYDQDKNVIVGRKNIEDNAVIQPIELNGDIIGWLSFIPSKLAEQSPANEFLARQYQSYMLIALFVVLLSFITAWYFSKHLVAPISMLNQGTKALIQGDFTTRLTSHTKDELAQLTQSVNVLAQTLEKNKTERSKWMSDISHELKTPLTVVRGQLIAIEDGIFKADEKRIQIMIDQIDTMSQLVGDIYQLSITDIGGLSYKKIPIDLIELLKNIALIYKLKTDELGINLDYSSILASGTTHWVMADKERLSQLFTNLLENSCRYTDAPAVICLSYELKETDIYIYIDDSSPSIPANDFTKVFERFYRVEPSRSREYGGSGIGLSLCKQIIEAHQGSIYAKQSQLGGVTMVLSFPLSV